MSIFLKNKWDLIKQEELFPRKSGNSFLLIAPAA